MYSTFRFDLDLSAVKTPPVPLIRTERVVHISRARYYILRIVDTDRTYSHILSAIG